MHHDVLSSAYFAFTAACAMILSKSIVISTTEAPQWVTTASGPLSIAGVMGVAVIWFARRMEKAESREVERQKSREDLLAKMTSANVRIADALERNSVILDKVEQHLKNEI